MFSSEHFNTTMSLFDLEIMDMSIQDKSIQKQEYQNQLTIEEIKKILDLPDSVFNMQTDKENGQVHPRDRNGSVCSSSTSSVETTSDMDWDTALVSSQWVQHQNFSLIPDFKEFSTMEAQWMIEEKYNPHTRKELSNSIENTAFKGPHVEYSDPSYHEDIIQVLNNSYKEGATSLEEITKYTMEKGTTTTGSNEVVYVQMEKVKIDSSKNTNHQQSFKEEVSFIELCKVCNAPAMKFCSYGGKVCSSCRAFFRRSVQSGYHSIFQCKQQENCSVDVNTKRKCRNCRFQRCLTSGMRITWVLSDDERNRRFNKLEKTKRMVKIELKDIIHPLERPSVISFTFTVEEKYIMEGLVTKFKLPWIQNFLKFKKDSAVDFIEHIYGSSNMKLESWENFKTSMGNNFRNYVLPSFPEMDELNPQDMGQLMNSPAAGIAQFFRSSQALDTTYFGGNKKPSCVVGSHVVQLSNNPCMVHELGIQDFLSRLDLSKDIDKATRRPAYDELYPDNWAGDREKEEMHKSAFSKMINWPVDDKNEFDSMMVGLMTLILSFNADFYSLINKKKVEKIQLKYIMILQRYLKYKLSPETSKTKFLEAMMLISQTQEAWEMSV